MSSVKVEGGVLTSKPNLQGASVKAEAEAIINASVDATLGPVTAIAESGSIVLTGSEVQAKIGRAPFSEPGMADRFLADPAFYKNLAAFVASELRRQANSLEGRGNLDLATKSQLNDLADGFQDVATELTTSNGVLTPKAAAAAAVAVTRLRAAYRTLAENCPNLLTFVQVGLAAVALSQFGLFDNNLVLEVSAAVIGGVGAASALNKKRD